MLLKKNLLCQTFCKLKVNNIFKIYKKEKEIKKNVKKILAEYKIILTTNSNNNNMKKKKAKD